MNPDDVAAIKARISTVLNMDSATGLALCDALEAAWAARDAALAAWHGMGDAWAAAHAALARVRELGHDSESLVRVEDITAAIEGDSQ